jgi:endonuclease I
VKRKKLILHQLNQMKSLKLFFVSANVIILFPLTSIGQTTLPYTPETARSIPIGYYNSAANLNCAPLKTALKNIITTGHTPQSYGALWTRYITDDIKPREVAPAPTYNNTANVIWDMYSDNPTGTDPYNFTPGTISSGGQQDDGSLGGLEGQRYNREHSVPTSWFNGNTGTAGTATDYIFIFPTDKRINTLHSNDLYGKVGTAGTITTTLNGSKSGLSATGVGYPNVTVFEPIDSFKGDIARAFLYFVTRYQDNIPGWSGNTFAFANNTYPSVETNYLNMMKSWHVLDPVSIKEMNRNDASYIHQGNRNPYIDSPQYVSKVWDEACLASLPLNFTYVKATQVNQHVLINWNVSNEQDVQYYTVEKSDDGVLFYEMGMVDKNNLQSYHYIDPLQTAQRGSIFYRIKKVGMSSQQYSEVVKISVVQNNFFTIYQDGTNNSILLKFKNSFQEKIQIRLVNSYGAMVYQTAVFSNEAQLRLSLPTLSRGIYFILIQSGQHSLQQKLFIQ